jgi:hypothetical protein
MPRAQWCQTIANTTMFQWVKFLDHPESAEALLHFLVDARQSSGTSIGKSKAEPLPMEPYLTSEQIGFN